jgi:uncharacterized protein YxeA
MKKILFLITLLLFIISCSQNYEKKKIPPSSPSNYKEAKPVQNE